MKRIIIGFISCLLLLACQKPAKPSLPEQNTPTKDEGKKDDEEGEKEPEPDEPETDILLRHKPPANPRFFNGPISLQDYLSAPIFEKSVYSLWEKGFLNFAPDKPLGKKRRASFDATRAGRSGDWIEATFGESEQALGEQLKSLEPPQTWTIKEIDELFLKITAASPADPKAPVPQFVMVFGFNVNYLPDVPLGNNAIVQLASQFNYLESPGSKAISVSGYLGDFTQGPQGVIEALAATLYRDAMANLTKKLQHALINILPANAENYYSDGYLEVAKASIGGDMNALNNAIEANIKNLRILPQWVMTEGSGATVLQVFSAAPSFQGYAEPAPKSLEAKVCIDLVSAQYEAIGKVAVIRAIISGQEVPLHLTLVGQKSFRNPAIVMTESFKRIARVVKGYKVKIYVHTYDDFAEGRFITAFNGNEGTFTKDKISKAEFAKLPAL